MMYRFFISLLLFAIVSSAVALPPGDSDPQAIVQQATKNILADLDANREEYASNPEKLREMVRRELLPLVDLDYSARLILGRTARGVSEEQLRAFAKAISDTLLNRYADGLLKFRSDQQVEILPPAGKSSDRLTRVRTRLKLENNSFTPIDYAFHKTKEGWKVFDVTVEGISYIVTFRNQLAPRVQADGIDKVTQEILQGNLKIDEAVS